MKKPGLGLIGHGWAARHLHLQSYGQLFELRAVCGRHESNVRVFQKELGFERAYTDYREMIRGDDIDVVVLCTPASLRLDVIRAAAEAGKHVFTEKPLAWNYSEAQKIVEICEHRDVKMAVADQYRFFPHIQRAASLIREGRIGRPFLGLLENKLYFDFPAYEEQKRGFVIEQVTHNFDVLRFLLNDEFGSVFARIGRSPAKKGRGDSRESWCAVTLVSRSDVTIQLFVSWECLGQDITRGQIEQGPEGRLHIEGDGGTLFMNRNDKLLTVYSKESDCWLDPEIQPVVTTEQMESYGTGEAMKTFLKCIEEGKEHPVSGREYLKNLAIAFAVYESAETGGVVEIES
jgi:predicted dehydrogenase